MARSLDQRMFAWYRMDETTGGDYLNLADSGPNARHLTAASIDVAPKITNGKNGVRYARVHDGTNDVMLRAADAGAAAAALQGDLTMEAFVRLDSSSAMALVAYTASGDASAASNIQALIRITAAQKQESFWEHGATGINDLVAQVAGAALVVGQWHHIAQVIDRTAKTVAFYLDGALQDTVAYADNPTGGSTANWYIGVDLPTSVTLRWCGAWKSIRVVQGKLTAAEVAADAALLNSTMLHDPTRAGTIVCYQANERPDKIDETAKGCHLHQVGSSITHGVDPLVQDGGHATYFSGGAELHGPVAPDPTGLAWNTFIDGEWSFEVWERIGDGNAADRGLFVYGDPGPEDAPNNFFAVQIESTRKLTVWSEHGAGLDATTVWTSTADILTATQVNGPHQLVVTKRNVSGGYILRAYRDGVFVEESPTITPDYDGGASGWLRLATGSSEIDWFGVLDEAVFWQAVLTDEEVADLHDIGTGESSDDTPSFVAPPTVMGIGQGGIGFQVD
jgi:hypothetical protein